MIHPIVGLPIDLEWPDGIDPTKWRDMEDPDGDNEEETENDEDTPTPDYVVDILGFDPHEFDEDDEEAGESEIPFDAAYLLADNVFCPTGKGGGVDPKCKTGRGSAKVKVKTKKAKTTLLSEIPKDEKEGVEYIKNNSKAAGGKSGIKLHGMREAAPYRTLKVEGAIVNYEEGTEAAVHTTLQNAKAVHPKLWAANVRVHFTNQKHIDDDKILPERFGLTPGRSSTVYATGGDGTVCVYGGKPLSSATIAHESAHNVATWRFGSTDPTKVVTSSLGRKPPIPGVNFSDQVVNAKGNVTNAVTEYGKNKGAEDFAEFVAAYNEIIVGGRSYKTATRAKLEARPHTLQSVKILLGDST